MAIRQQLILSGASLLKLSSFMFWSWLYLWTAASVPDHTPEWYSRVVTLLHGSVASLVGLIQCDFMNITPCRLTMEVSAAQYALMAWSWGYFAMDFMWCVVYWSENLVMLSHHLSALYAVSLYMDKRYAGCTFACTLSLMEITNPLLQTRWVGNALVASLVLNFFIGGVISNRVLITRFIKDSGLGKTTLFLIVEVAYLATFILVRGMIGSYVVYRILDSDIFDLEEKIISVVFYVLSWVFIYDIYGYIRHKYEDRIDEAGVIKAERSATDGSASGAEPPAAVGTAAPPVTPYCRLHDRNSKNASNRVQTLPWTMPPKNFVLINKSYKPLKSGTAKCYNFDTHSSTILSTIQ